MRRDEGLAPFFAIGDGRSISAVWNGPIERIATPDATVACFDRALPVLAGADGDYTPGRPDSAGARLALASLAEAAAQTVEGFAAAVVTGPIHKARLAEIGFTHPGQTEFMAAACAVDPGDAVMMLAGPNLRTVPLTVHIPLGEVAGAISEALIERKGRIVAVALMRDFGLSAPRLAVAALNPHAGEDGRMGDEEARFIRPAVERLRKEGIAIDGPFAADGLFAPRQRATFDVALCMYHDQALIPLKALDFDQGVNVTLGLPIIRTSPDHGTAFGIAGTGQADAGAMIAAIRMAGECAQRRFGN